MTNYCQFLLKTRPGTLGRRPSIYYYDTDLLLYWIFGYGLANIRYAKYNYTPLIVILTLILRDVTDFFVSYILYVWCILPFYRYDQFWLDMVIVHNILLTNYEIYGMSIYIYCTSYLFKVNWFKLSCVSSLMSDGVRQIKCYKKWIVDSVLATEILLVVSTNQILNL